MLTFGTKISTETAIQLLMKDKAGQELARLCYYDSEVIDACERYLASEEWEAISMGLGDSSKNHGKRALDLGAGNGIASYALAKSGFKVYAAEPDPSDLVGYGAINKVVSETALDISHVSAFGEQLPFQDGEFDLVFMRQVLHHASNLDRMIGEVARILKPQGLVMAVREHVVNNEIDLEHFLENHPLHHQTQTESAYTLNTYLAAFENAGLKKKKVLGSWDSVINFYPTSLAEFDQEMRRYAKARFGAFGNLVMRSSAWKRRYSKLKSEQDCTPGRFYSFIFQK